MQNRNNNTIYQNGGTSSFSPSNGINNNSNPLSRSLTDEEFDRYSRQMIVPGMGKEGQLRLLTSRVLIIGAGGLGCPAAQYIAGAGIGTIGIVDGDVVEPSNLHRQVGHATSRIGTPKVTSLITHLSALNPLPTYIPHPCHITPDNAADLIAPYDLVLDCTDNPATRYLISDVCVLLRKPLVSAASVQKSGQLVVLNCPATPQGEGLPEGGKYNAAPCYRCCFKQPPPAAAALSCGEAGIMGPVVGLMGVAQAGEAVKILASGLHAIPSSDGATGQEEPGRERNLRQPTLLIYSYDLDAAVGPYAFRALKMAGRKKSCFACGEGSRARLTLGGIKKGEPDYVQFCSAPTARVTLPVEERITAAAYHEARERGEIAEHVLIDTREREHFSFGSIDGAVNVPFGKLLMAAAVASREGASGNGNGNGFVEKILPEEVRGKMVDGGEDLPIYVVCRRGLDSQEAVEKLRGLGMDNGGRRKILDIMGGMKAWKEEVDPSFPFI
ncbi:hypothetical protein B0T17DRAFT_491760 [Bombardia bombarda]|uniref:Adenylyltransferase and sulfurtransferase uba4 n=1 Tax=Bombardia bombarda TaxID=252184 RepID=A0AA40C4I7_9PEZI|nr:hypothetical protein B0T17DRAFT_491760 [Bombardia bombarda]